MQEFIKRESAERWFFQGTAQGTLRSPPFCAAVVGGLTSRAIVVLPRQRAVAECDRFLWSILEESVRRDGFWREAAEGWLLVAGWRGLWPLPAACRRSNSPGLPLTPEAKGRFQVPVLENGFV